MVGVNPKFQRRGCEGEVIKPGAAWRMQPETRRANVQPLRWFAILSVFVPLSFVLVQCGKAPNAGLLAANSQASKQASAQTSVADSFDDRFPAPQFRSE